MQLVRTETPGGSWLQLEGDTPEEWEILEQLAVRGIRTNGPDVLEQLRLEALLEAWNRAGGQPQGEWCAGYWSLSWARNPV